MEAAQLQVASRSQPEAEFLRKYPLPSPLNTGDVKVPALNWTSNKPDGNTPHVGFDELFRSEEDDDDTGQQDSGTGPDTTLDISEEDLKPKHELLESMETTEIDIVGHLDECSTQPLQNFDISEEDLEPSHELPESMETMELNITDHLNRFSTQPSQTLDIREEDPKQTHELPEFMVTMATEIKIKVEDFEQDTGNNIRTTEDLPTTEIPQKRRRVIMEAVEVPSVSWVISKRQDIKLERIKREQEHKNPRWEVKVKKDCEFGFSLDTVFRRIDDLGIKEYPLHLDEEFLNTTTTRDFLSSIFGGNAQQTFPKISEKNFKRHGYDDFMYLNLDYNPRAPQRAGFPGLYFTCAESGPTAIWDGQHRVFIRIAAAIWLYVGQYEMIRAPGLTVVEWKTQSHRVMTTWAEKVSTQRWGGNVRTRVTLRKTLQREPTAEEFEQGLLQKFQPTPEEVMEAYNSGQEKIGVWVMKCIGYDEAFQRMVVEKYQHWAPKEKSAKVPKRKRS